MAICHAAHERRGRCKWHMLRRHPSPSQPKLTSYT
jgi:hypothetical protein